MNRDRHKRKALKHLNDAFQKSDGALALAWAEDDPALETVRGDGEWTVVMERYRGTPVTTRYRPRFDSKTKIRGYPERPWGDPVPRVRTWLAIAAFWLVLWLILQPGWGPAGIALLLALAVSLWRARLAYREANRARVTEGHWLKRRL